MSCGEHAWSLPGSMFHERDEEMRVEGECRRCGQTETKPIWIWYAEIEASIERPTGVKVLQ